MSICKKVIRSCGCKTKFWVLKRSFKLSKHLTKWTLNLSYFLFLSHHSYSQSPPIPHLLLQVFNSLILTSHPFLLFFFFFFTVILDRFIFFLHLWFFFFLSFSNSFCLFHGLPHHHIQKFLFLFLVWFFFFVIKNKIV